MRCPPAQPQGTEPSTEFATISAEYLLAGTSIPWPNNQLVAYSSAVEKGEIFAAVAEERRGLADLLDTFSEAQWAAASLCEAWTVRDVAAHLVTPLITPMRKAVVAVAKARGDLDKAIIAMTASVARRHGDNLPALLRQHANNRFQPPLIGPMAPLTEVTIHGQDIRRPLGLSRTFTPAQQLAILDFLTSPAAKRAFRRNTTKVRWEATDLGWSHGDGPAVRGPAEAIMLALTGRRAALADLRGDGTEQLGNHL
ncbi:maleylpyruvate isomerase family mycothiol-dependent enzyme [Mycobacterium sp. pUA109]|uniref:maleylpyruvate isomerase family mycothiol-dependent enzyme n=1 Tax=Mycobacterium sp. pUA109 TaxID=3238982 RepID=UPI00351B057E